jgi:micrococcal nuclease
LQAKSQKLQANSCICYTTPMERNIPFKITLFILVIIIGLGLFAYGYPNKEVLTVTDQVGQKPHPRFEYLSASDPLLERRGSSGIVTHVTDGDTFDIMIDGTKSRVRMLGINTPESVDPRRPVECFGREASNYLKDLINNKQVTLEKDPDKPGTDEYGRLLRYVFLGDININEQMIRDGYAYEYTYKSEKYMYQNQFKQAEKFARENKLGLWADSTCHGEK